MRQGWLLISLSLVVGLSLFGEVAAAATVEEVKLSSRRPGMTPRFPEFGDLDGAKELERLCVEKVAGSLPLISVPVSDLGIGDIVIHTEAGYYTVLLTVTRPQSKMKKLYWGADTLDEIMVFVRLLQEGKLSALNVEAYSLSLRVDQGKTLSFTELQSCARDQVKEFLEICKECMVVEWVLKKAE